MQTNVVGTHSLLKAARAVWLEGSGVPHRFHHVSTDEVYGTLRPDDPAFCETTPYAPNSPYSATKAGADHLVRAYYHTYGLGTLITNCSNNYGPYQFPEKLIPLMILNAADGKNLPIYGDGANIRDWIYVEDHCAGIRLALERGQPGEKYNLGGDNERTNLQVVDRICEILDDELPASDNPALAGRASYSELTTFVPDRPGHDQRYAIDNTKAGGELGWRAVHDFESGIRESVRWYLAQRDGWCRAVTEGRYERERLGLGT